MSLLKRMEQKNNEDDSIARRESVAKTYLKKRQTFMNRSRFRTKAEREHDEYVYGRWNEILDLWRQHQWLYAVAGFLAGILFFPLLQTISSGALSFVVDLIPEAIGIGFTVFFIDVINRRREEMQHIRDLQDVLLRRSKSTANDTAKTAIDELNHFGWLHGKNGLLKGEDLYRANLADARLSSVNLSDCILCRANLSGAWLLGANLNNANIFETVFDEKTTLPDGSKWSVDTDMSKFGAIYVKPEWIQV
ncbi:MAG: pentapeptide repeat-containing protein [Chloroflexota bacterium]